MMTWSIIWAFSTLVHFGGPASAPDSLLRDFYLTETRMGYHMLDLDTAYNHGSSYGWGSTYFLQAEILAYEATRDTALLSHFVHMANIMLARRDDSLNFSDWKGEVGPGWSTRRRWNPKLGTNVNGAAPMRDLVEDANIVYPYLRFSEIVLADSSRPSRFVASAKYYIHQSEKVIQHHIASEWRADWRRFAFPKGSPMWCDGVNVPNNYEALVGSDLLILYRLTNKKEYLTIASVIAEHLKESLTLTKEGCYVWRYWSGKGMMGWSASDSLSVNTPSSNGQSSIEDISHGGVDVSFMIDCYESQLVFDKTDMVRITNTFQKAVNRGAYLSYDLEGKGQDDAATYKSPFGGWLRLARFDQSIPSVFYRIYYPHIRASDELGRLSLLVQLLRNMTLR